jgi:hypothetical protein
VDLLTYTLIAGIDLPEAIDRHGRLGRLATVETVEALPFTLHERSERPPAGPVTFIALEDGAYWLTVGGERGPNFHYCAVPDPA